MASVITNKLKWRLLGWSFVAQTIPTNYYIALITNATAPDADTNTFSQLTEINTGYGYSAGGTSLTPGGTDFDVHTEDDANDRGLVQLKDIVWTASGGPIPNGGTGAYYAILTDDDGVQGDREIYTSWDLTGPISISDGQSLTLQNCEMRIT